MSCSSTQHGAPNEDRVPLPNLQEAEVKNKSVARLKKQLALKTIRAGM